MKLRLARRIGYSWCYLNTVYATIAGIIGDSGWHFKAAISVTLIDAIFIALNNAHICFHLHTIVLIHPKIIHESRMNHTNIFPCYHKISVVGGMRMKNM